MLSQCVYAWNGNKIWLDAVFSTGFKGHFRDQMYLFIVKPSAPVQLEVVGLTDDSITLSWLSPERDGGSRIHGYVIECRELGGPGTAGSGWTRVKQVDSSDVLVTCIEGLRVGVSYRFRVYAENEAGSGPPVELRQPVVPRSQLGMFYQRLITTTIFVLLLSKYYLLAFRKAVAFIGLCYPVTSSSLSSSNVLRVIQLTNIIY